MSDCDSTCGSFGLWMKSVAEAENKSLEVPAGELGNVCCGQRMGPLECRTGMIPAQFYLKAEFRFGQLTSLPV